MSIIRLQIFLLVLVPFALAAAEERSNDPKKAADQGESLEFEPGVSWPNLAHNLLPIAPEYRKNFGIGLRNYSSLQWIDTEGTLRKLPYPKDRYNPEKTVQYLNARLQGPYLLATWKENITRYDPSAVKELGVLDLRWIDRDWRVFRPPAESPDISADIHSFALDGAGRAIMCQYMGDTLYFQSKPGMNSFDGTLKPLGKDLILPELQTVACDNGAVFLVANSPLRPVRDFILQKGKADPTDRLSVRMPHSFLFKDGELRKIDHPRDNQVTYTAIVLPGARVFLSFTDGPGAWYSAETGKPLKKGPFDPAKFGKEQVFTWDCASDGTLWMLTTSEADCYRENDRMVHGLWRWDGKRLEKVHHGVDWVLWSDDWLPYQPLLAVSRDEVLAGTYGRRHLPLASRAGKLVGQATWSDFTESPEAFLAQGFSGQRNQVR